MQPLHQSGVMASLKTPKGVLRRMPRVRSDEIQAETDEHHSSAAPAPATITTAKEKSPSPIGAGLPLLQRLHLLKEKQVSYSFISQIFTYIFKSISICKKKQKIEKKKKSKYVPKLIIYFNFFFSFFHLLTEQKKNTVMSFISLSIPTIVKLSCILSVY